jgi:hypothetical protein
LPEIQQTLKYNVSMICVRIILILMEDVDSSKFDDDLQLYIKTKTYVKREDPWFWEKVLYAMPEITNRGDNHLNDIILFDFSFKTL